MVELMWWGPNSLPPIRDIQDCTNGSWCYSVSVMPLIHSSACWTRYSNNLFYWKICDNGKWEDLSMDFILYNKPSGFGLYTLEWKGLELYYFILFVLLLDNKSHIDSQPIQTSLYYKCVTNLLYQSFLSFKSNLFYSLHVNSKAFGLWVG